MMVPERKSIKPYESLGNFTTEMIEAVGKGNQVSTRSQLEVYILPFWYCLSPYHTPHTLALHAGPSLSLHAGRSILSNAHSHESIAQNGLLHSPHTLSFYPPSNGLLHPPHNLSFYPPSDGLLHPPHTLSFHPPSNGLLPPPHTRPF